MESCDCIGCLYVTNDWWCKLHQARIEDVSGCIEYQKTLAQQLTEVRAMLREIYEEIQQLKKKKYNPREHHLF